MRFFILERLELGHLTSLYPRISMLRHTTSLIKLTCCYGINNSVSRFSVNALVVEGFLASSAYLRDLDLIHCDYHVDVISHN